MADRFCFPGTDTLQTALNLCASGDTLYTHGGVYTATGSYALDVAANATNRTIVAYPGERAVIRGLVVVRGGANSCRIAGHTIEQVPGTATSNLIQVLQTTGFTLEDCIVDGKALGRGGLILGDAGNLVTTPTLQRNVFRSNGLAANLDQDHHIYLANVSGGIVKDSVFHDQFGYAFHMYPSCNGVTLSHNVVDATGSTYSGIIFASEAGSPNKTSNNIVEYNVLYGATNYAVSHYWGGSAGSGNIVRFNVAFANGLGDFDTPVGWTQTSNTHADPQFGNRTFRNYTIQNAAVLAVVGYDTAALLNYNKNPGRVMI